MTLLSTNVHAWLIAIAQAPVKPSKVPLRFRNVLTRLGYIERLPVMNPADKFQRWVLCVTLAGQQYIQENASDTDNLSNREPANRPADDCPVNPEF